ncbi:diguanylate cyclase [Conexibacter sp. JD483]|uniref:diguanylate cyclase domain-containing protein n=1 Tax=unclassified Conexibacter TaxID=2627773 RepID=UPI002723427D|nr:MULTISPECIES: diguanylate cyclase [unclassified Conexibacter]MDO8187389.1 diguanylate cyclase [Conexibacter sp. CPCC 205706]MDO8200984.1 diguanylate cyclase [Conexibacter sp. CPCC 205762]MDR9371394.1 diguanylate cyclase [Conexibacter sp. JD483]
MERWSTSLQAGETELLAGFPAPVYVVDGEWRLLVISEEGAALVGRVPAELVGRTMWENYPDLRGTIVERELTRALEQRVPVRFEHRYEPLDLWFSVKATPHQDGLLIAYDDISDQKRAERRATELAAEQAALARIADAIARAVPPRRLFAIVAEEAARLTDIEACAVVQFSGPGSVKIVGISSRHPNPLLPSGEEVPDRGLFDRLRRSGELVHIRDDDERLGPLMREYGRLAWLQMPVFVAGGLWGALVLSTNIRRDVFDDHAIARQRDFAELLSVAIGNADAHDKLARMAANDPVTGLANHRVFHARLREAAAEATRRGRPLTVAVFDLDRFRDVNDLHGHLAGDAILSEVAARLSEHAAPDQLLARIGGDEFALVMPGWAPAAARPIVERACAAIAARPFGERRSELTISAGIADLEAAGHGELLFACADGALYWAKLNGRDLVCTFEPSIVNELSPTDRAETLLRRKTLAGITALARAIDAKDPTTRQHSERVAQLVDQLARVCGWAERRIRLLREAALVHDVGKIGIPDAILLQTGRLTADQFEAIKRHAPLGADIVDGVLLPEQVEWVRHHHERPDGGGYPDGLGGAQISSGCALLSIADTLDVMTVSRPYSRPLPLDEAVSECERLVGTQFTPEAATALRTLHRMGALEDWDVPPPGGDGRR